MPPPPRRMPDALHEIETIQRGHMEVGNDQIEGLRHERCKGRASISRFHDGMPHRVHELSDNQTY
jgi:hypothetical protein